MATQVNPAVIVNPDRFMRDRASRKARKIKPRLGRAPFPGIPQKLALDLKLLAKIRSQQVWTQMLIRMCTEPR